MSDKIINSIPFNDHDKNHILRHYGKKTSSKDMFVDGVIIKLKLTKKDVEKYYENWYLDI
jgi:hypothetical protein